MSYRSQRKMICMYKWDVQVAMALIEQERVSSFVAPAAMTGDLVIAAGQSNRDLSTLATVGGGGAPRAPEQVKRISQSFGKALPNTGWGMTETNAIGTGISGEDYLAHGGAIVGSLRMRRPRSVTCLIRLAVMRRFWFTKMSVTVLRKLGCEPAKLRPF